MEENDKIIAIAILSMLALIALIGFIFYKIVIYKKSISNINVAAPPSVPVKNNNFKLVDPKAIIEIKKNDGKEIPKATDLGKLISVKTEYGITSRIYQKEIIDKENGKIITIERLTKQKKGGKERLFQQFAKEDVIGNVNGAPIATWTKEYGENYDMDISTTNYNAERLKQPKIDNKAKQKQNKEEKFDLQMDDLSFNNILEVGDLMGNSSISLNLIEFSSSSDNSSIISSRSNSASGGSDDSFVEIPLDDLKCDLESLSNNEADYNFKKAKLRLSSDEEGDDVSQMNALNKKVIEAFSNFKDKVKNVTNNVIANISNVTSNNKPNENTPLLKGERQGPFFNNLESDDPLRGNEESNTDKLKGSLNSALNSVSNALHDMKNPFRKKGPVLSFQPYNTDNDDG